MEARDNEKTYRTDIQLVEKLGFPVGYGNDSHARLWPLPRYTTTADSNPATADSHEFADVNSISKGRSIHLRFYILSGKNTAFMLRDGVFMYFRV